MKRIFRPLILADAAALILCIVMDAFGVGRKLKDIKALVEAYNHQHTILYGNVAIFLPVLVFFVVGSALGLTGMYRYRRYGFAVFAATTCLGLLFNFTSGLTLHTPLVSFFSDLDTLLSGFLLAAFFHPDIKALIDRR
jgi:type IV secretory pathway VirB2 component (pilin)